jgi:hypothetical protein
MAFGVRCTLIVLGTVAMGACARGPNVERAFGGAVVEGRYIEAPAYSAFLRASIADATGDSRDAVDAYREAARWDPEAREAMTASGTVRCRIDPCPSASVDARPLAAETSAPRLSNLALRVNSLEALARLDPSRRDAAARAAEDLAGIGVLGAARSLAAAAVEASDEPFPGDRALAGRLAVDEAVGRGALSLLRHRATRSRIGLEETAARALLAGRRDVARSLSFAELLADPEAFGARLVFAAAGGSDVMGLLEAPRVGSRPISAAEWVAYGQALQHVVGPGVARSRLEALHHEFLIAGDDRVVRAAVDLASRRVIAAEALPATGAVELAVICRGGPAGSARQTAFDLAALDLRHRYLFFAYEAPSDPHTRELGERLRESSSDDPIVAAAEVLVELAEGTRFKSQRARALLDHDPGDLLLATVALSVAEKIGDSETAKLAHAVLAFVKCAGREPP